MNTYKLFQSLNDKKLLLGYYLVKNGAMRKVQISDVHRVLDFCSWFNHGAQAFNPIKVVNKKDDDYSEFVHNALMEALWASGSSVDAIEAQVAERTLEKHFLEFVESLGEDRK
jgi:hypothetical protein